MTIRFVCALIFVSTLSSVAYPEGGTSGGDGGHGVLCDRKLSAPNRFSLELLDLYEARRLYPRDFSPVEPILGPARGGDLEYIKMRRYLSNALEVLEGELGRTHEVVQRLRTSKDAFESRYEISRSNDHLPFLTDLGANCNIIQLALSVSYETVIADRFYTLALPDLDLAALHVHERLHGYFRSSSGTHAVRQLVTYTFASKQFRNRNRRLFHKLVRTRSVLDRPFISEQD